MKHKIIVVGDIKYNVISDPLPADINIRRDGEYITKIENKIGGQGAIFSIVTSKLGAKTIFYGKLGKDKLGIELKKIMKKNKVGCKIELCDKTKTGGTICISWKNGERYFITDNSNNETLNTSDINTDEICNAHHFARRGIWFSPNMLKYGNLKLLKFAKKKKIETSIDIGWDPYWNTLEQEKIEKRKECVRKLFYETDILFCNDKEIKKIMNENLNDSINLLQNYNIKLIVMHMGKKGSMIISEQEEYKIPAPKIKTRINLTGSGDVYDAMFIISRLNGKSILESAEMASECAGKHIENITQLFSLQI